ncbi:MAG: SRPBCC family protein, partial [Aggregatilineales bacterium]
MTEKPPLRIQMRLSASPKRVFEALTDNAALKTWFAEDADIQPDKGDYRFGGRFTPNTQQPDSYSHKIITFEPGQALAYQWQLDDVLTTVQFKLAPQQNAEETILTLIHDEATHGSHQRHGYAMEDFWFLSLENLRRYLDGRDCSVRVDFTNRMHGDVQCSTTIDAPAAEVFNVLLTPERLNQWIATSATVIPEKDGKFDLGWGEDVTAMQIAELETDKKLSLSWMEDIDPETLLETRTTWTLAENNGKTHITFVHSGFDDDEDNRGIYAGWHNFLNWLRSAVEYGETWTP